MGSILGDTCTTKKFAVVDGGLRRVFHMQRHRNKDPHPRQWYFFKCAICKFPIEHFKRIVKMFFSNINKRDKSCWSLGLFFKQRTDNIHHQTNRSENRVRPGLKILYPPYRTNYYLTALNHCHIFTFYGR